jgi:hypothetical protein
MIFNQELEYLGNWTWEKLSYNSSEIIFHSEGAILFLLYLTPFKNYWITDDHIGLGIWLGGKFCA